MVSQKKLGPELKKTWLIMTSNGIPEQLNHGTLTKRSKPKQRLTQTTKQVPRLPTSTYDELMKHEKRHLNPNQLCYFNPLLFSGVPLLIVVLFGIGDPVLAY